MLVSDQMIWLQSSQVHLIELSSIVFHPNQRGILDFFFQIIFVFQSPLNPSGEISESKDCFFVFFFVNLRQLFK